MLRLNHKKLDVWKMSVSLVTEIYKLSEKFPKSENYGIIHQLRRAAVSIPSNSAEGASRKSLTERKRFFEIARFSLVEIDTQIFISLELKYCKAEDLNEISDLLNIIFAMLSKLIQKSK